MTFHHTLAWNSTMHDLSKTILRHGVPLSIDKLPIYLICPHPLFFSSILRLPILQLFLCHIHLCPHHATHTVSPATCMHSYDCGLPAGIYPHNHKPHCRGVAIVQQPSWGRWSREARRRRAFLLVFQCIEDNSAAKASLECT